MSNAIPPGEIVPVIPIDKAQQIRRVLVELVTWLGALGVAVNAYGPAVIQLAPNLKWLPAALALIGLAAKIWQKANDVKNVTPVNLS